MFKLLLCSALIVPCMMLPFTGNSESLSEIDTVSFDEAYIAPELMKIESCETADLDVFFHDAYITMHSAEYLTEAVTLAKACETAAFTVTPIFSKLMSDADRKLADTQVDELLLILQALNVTAKLAEAKIQTNFDSLTMNGRTATVSVEANSSKNS